MTVEEAKEIIIKERDSMRANPMVKVEDCLYEAYDMAIKALEQQIIHGSTYGDVSWGGTYTFKEQQSCEDCISRKAIKGQMIKYGFKAPDMTVTEFVEDCLPSVTPKVSWIPVSERLPEEEGNYLVCYNNGYISVSEWHPNPYEKVCFDIFPSLIIAWMPLPKSYKTESEGDK